MTTRMHMTRNTRMITSTRMLMTMRIRNTHTILGLRIMDMLTYRLTASTCEWALPWGSTSYS